MPTKPEESKEGQTSTKKNQDQLENEQTIQSNQESSDQNPQSNQSQSNSQTQPHSQLPSQMVETSSTFDPKPEIVEQVEEIERPPQQQQLGGESEEKEEVEQKPETMENVADLMMSTAIGTISNIAVNATGVNEVAFSEDETQTLVDVWKPFVAKDISPIWAAIIATTIIVGSKVAIYVRCKGKKTDGV